MMAEVFGILIILGIFKKKLNFYNFKNQVDEMILCSFTAFKKAS
jgi:hypothetical protein